MIYQKTQKELNYYVMQVWCTSHFTGKNNRCFSTKNRKKGTFLFSNRDHTSRICCPYHSSLRLKTLFYNIINASTLEIIFFGVHFPEIYHMSMRKCLLIWLVHTSRNLMRIYLFTIFVSCLARLVSGLLTTRTKDKLVGSLLIWSIQ